VCVCEFVYVTLGVCGEGPCVPGWMKAHAAAVVGGVVLLLLSGVLRAHPGAVGSVAVISPYKAQVATLREEFRRELGGDPGLAAASTVEFSTVDGFQGREAEVVVFSCVRAQPDVAAAAADVLAAAGWQQPSSGPDAADGGGAAGCQAATGAAAAAAPAAAVTAPAAAVAPVSDAASAAVPAAAAASAAAATPASQTRHSAGTGCPAAVFGCHDLVAPPPPPPPAAAAAAAVVCHLQLLADQHLLQVPQSLVQWHQQHQVMLQALKNKQTSATSSPYRSSRANS